MYRSSKKSEENKSLWKSYVKGDKLAFGKLYAHYHRSLTAYCLGRLGRLELAENAASDTLIKLMEYSNPEKIENFESWMFTVAKNICTTHLTTAMRRNNILHDNYNVINAHEPEIDGILLRQNIDQIIKSTLDHMDFKIWQLHQQGYENFEIAQQVGMSEKTVANRKSMTRLKLKEVLSKMIDK